LTQPRHWDPANLYGAGAPFKDLAWDFQRRQGSWLVLQAGRPILLAEFPAKRLTALESATADDLGRAVALLPAALDGDRRRLTIEEWNGQPVTSLAAAPLLERAGFVRDYNGMTLYAAWR
jgi:hypothetical protein